MNQTFVRIWDEHKGGVEAKLREEHPGYGSIVKHVVQMIFDHFDDYSDDW